MKFFKRMKDGGQESRVEGFWLIESKRLFSIVLLHFSHGSRDAYHSHAFNSISWLLRGGLIEDRMLNDGINFVSVFKPSLRPIVTTRDNLHQVRSNGGTWVLSFRGPWAMMWREYLPKEKKFITLTHGRKVVG